MTKMQTTRTGGYTIKWKAKTHEAEKVRTSLSHKIGLHGPKGLTALQDAINKSIHKDAVLLIERTQVLACAAPAAAQVRSVTICRNILEMCFIYPNTLQLQHKAGNHDLSIKVPTRPAPIKYP